MNVVEAHVVVYTTSTWPAVTWFEDVGERRIPATQGPWGPVVWGEISIIYLFTIRLLLDRVSFSFLGIMRHLKIVNVFFLSKYAD